MVAVLNSTLGRKQKAGRALLAIGASALFIQCWSLWLEAGSSVSGAATASLGWMGALGMATLHMVDFLAFHPNGVLLSLARVLLLCWPMAVIISGLVISRNGR